MTAAVQVFNFQDQGFTVWDHDNGTSLLERDQLAAYLGYSRPWDMTRILREKDMMVVPKLSTHDSQADCGDKTVLITEAGVYRILMRANRPEAVEFQEKLSDFLVEHRKGNLQIVSAQTALTAETAKHLAAFAGALAAIERKYDYELEQNKRVERIQAIEWKERKRLDKTVKELRKEITELRQAVPDKPKDPNGPVWDASRFLA